MEKSAKRIAVIGQGIMGLTCAYRLLDQGFKIDIFSRDDFWKTTSTSAGAFWWPHRAYPEERVAQWAKETYDIYTADQTNPDTGVSFGRHLRFCLDPDDGAYARDILDECKAIDGQDYGVNCSEAFLAILPVIDVPIYMAYLKAEIEARLNAAGGQIYVLEVPKITELYPDYDLVINCSGVGARQLVNDEDVFPIRGQTVLVALSSEITKSTRVYQKNDEFTLVLPRKNDIVLGGTAQDNDWSLEIREKDSHEILEHCRKFVPSLKDCDVLGAAVGLRPGRHEIRLELEMLSENQPVIHNYGHGGGGYTVSWGCAMEVQRLINRYFSLEST